jgi:hypothetical protein
MLPFKLLTQDWLVVYMGLWDCVTHALSIVLAAVAIASKNSQPNTAFDPLRYQ